MEMVNLKLKTKLAALMAIVVAIPIIVGVGLTYFTIRSSITNMEVENSKKQLINAQNYIRSLISAQRLNLTSWLPWDDFYYHVKERNIEEIKTDLGEAKEDTPVEVLGVLDHKFNPIYFSDSSPKEWNENKLEDTGFAKYLNKSSNYYCAFQETEEGIYLVAIGKITHSEDKNFNNTQGYLVLARKLKTSMLESGKEILGLDFAIRFDEKNILSTDEDIVFLNKDTPREIQSVSRIENDSITIATVDKLKDEEGNVIGTIQIVSTSSSGVKTLDLLLVSFLVLLGVVLILSIGVTAAGIHISIINPLKKVVSITENTAKGNLKSEIDYESKDEIGILAKGFNSMVKSLRELIFRTSSSSLKIVEASELLTSSINENTEASDQMAKAIQDITTSSTVQMSKINNINNAINKLSDKVKKIAHNAYLISDISEKANSYANSGSVEVKNAIKQMNSINNVVIESSKTIKGLYDKSSKIDNIADIIKSIGDKTNLLALNAAIEAARAGESGKGFAVVAEEVRNLAEQSSNSTKDISQIIDLIQKDIEQSDVIIDKGLKASEEGIKRIENLGGLFNKILTFIDKLSLEIKQITQSINDIEIESNVLVKYANDTMIISKSNLENTEMVASGTEKQKALIEQILSLSGGLEDLAAELQELVKKFIL